MEPGPKHQPPKPRWQFEPEKRYPGRVGPANGGAILVQPHETIEAALRRLKRHLQSEGIPHEVRRREHFIPKGKAKRSKSHSARKRAGSL